jgi:hypothetical protein
MFLQGSVDMNRKPSFKFEIFWLRIQGFKETITEAWNKATLAIGPIHRVHLKLSRTAKALRKWQRLCIGDLRMQIATAKEIILRLNQAEEARPLSDEERDMRRQIKSSYLGLLSIQKIKLLQRSSSLGSDWGTLTQSSFTLGPMGAEERSIYSPGPRQRAR